MLTGGEGSGGLTAEGSAVTAGSETGGGLVRRPGSGGSQAGETDTVSGLHVGVVMTGAGQEFGTIGK